MVYNQNVIANITPKPNHVVILLSINSDVMCTGRNNALIFIRHLPKDEHLNVVSERKHLVIFGLQLIANDLSDVFSAVTNQQHRA